MRISYNTIRDNLDIEEILKITSYKIGLVLDMDCSRSQLIFDQVFVKFNLKKILF